MLPLKVLGQWTESVNRFPQISQILNEYWPTMQNVALSRLPAHGHLNPHAGVPILSQKGLRVLLPLIVPGRAILCVGGETRTLHIGEPLIFDEMQTHFAANEAASDRIVLLFDVPRPPAHPFRPAADSHWMHDKHGVDETDLIIELGQHLTANGPSSCHGD